mmetsp:Transcript_11207/g.11269  ORF Transcript_11207/g.11269 Transcript_11207/m.11269 type:complete len:231 (+) Transcript_11207:1709-2401(+)
MAFNDKDTFLTIVTNDGFLYLYDIVNFKRGDGSIDRNCDFKSCLFLSNPPPVIQSNDRQMLSKAHQKEEFKMIVVGSEAGRGLIRVFNQKEDVEMNIEGTNNKKFTEVCLLKSFANSIENLIVGTDKGQLKVTSLPPGLYSDVEFDSFNAHAYPSEVVKIVTSPDGRYVFSAGSDGVIFVYSVTEMANESALFKQEVVVSSAKDEQAKLMTGIMNSSGPAGNQMHMVVDE